MVGGSSRTHPDFQGKGILYGFRILHQMAQQANPNLDMSLYTSYQWEWHKKVLGKDPRYHLLSQKVRKVKR